MNGVKDGLIYKLTFSNGKVYVGMTRRTLPQRLYCHRFKARSENPKLLLHRAWKLHGEPVAEVIARVPVCELGTAEIAAIARFGAFGPGGYNMTAGGEISPMLTPAIVEKVRALAKTPERIAKTKATHIGTKRSPETCAEISRALKGVGAGVPKSPEHRRKISEANRGKYHLPPGRKNSEATKAKMSDSAKRRWDSPEVRLKMSAVAKAREAKKRLP